MKKVEHLQPSRKFKFSLYPHSFYLISGRVTIIKMKKKKTANVAEDVRKSNPHILLVK